MITASEKKYQNVIETVFQNHQEQVFRFWNELNKQQKNNLLNQLSRMDFRLLQELIDLGLGKKQQITEAFRMEPTEVLTLKKRVHRDAAVLPLGEETLRAGQVAAFLVAGGQATRLGFAGPKGIFPISPVKNKSMFQLHAEKIRAVSHRYNTIIPWYIMTSESNYTETVDFFVRRHFFGLAEQNVIFFKQEMLPSISMQGKLLLSNKDRIALSPNGHGGSVKALWDSGALHDMRRRGIRYLFYFQVDNVLIKICDPVFLGYHIASRAEMSNKAVRKQQPQERVGVICKINGKDGVVEYSDLSPEDMEARADGGELKYWAGSIAIHIFNVDFLIRENEMGFKLPYHVARKIVPYLNEAGQLITPEEKNGLKFESFVFDLLLDAKKTFTMEVERSSEFSAVKNKQGTESPQTARRDLLKKDALLLREAGFDIPCHADGLPKFNIEISSLFALDAEELRRKAASLPELKEGFYAG